MKVFSRYYLLVVFDFHYIKVGRNGNGLGSEQISLCLNGPASLPPLPESGLFNKQFFFFNPSTRPVGPHLAMSSLGPIREKFAEQHIFGKILAKYHVDETV